MELGGRWLASEASDDLRRSFPRPDLDDSGWQPLTVPGHWQGEPGFAGSDGPLFYRRRFTTEPLADRQRAWLVLEGIFYQSDVWLDGLYLGDTEGYFFPHSFDVTAALEARPDHVLALEVVCERPARRAANRSLTGVFGRWDCIDPAYNPGGIWAPVGLTLSGPVQIASLRATCMEANGDKAVLDVEATLDSAEATTVALRTEVSRSGAGETVATVDKQQPLAAGANRVRWQVTVPSPNCGGQPGSASNPCTTCASKPT